jgi:outer membrane immunogenic protein
MTLRKYLWIGAAAGALLGAAQANAADLNRGYKDTPMEVAPAMWSGLYVGANGGYAWRQTDDLFSMTGFAGIGSEGGFGGGQIGYLWRGLLGAPSLVFGLEADFQGADIKGGATSGGLDYSTNLDWFGTVRGRVGFTAGNAMLYSTGGFAFGGLKQHAENGAVHDFDDTVTGYDLGGGIEYKFSPSWSVKAEYQYMNFGKNEPAGAAADGISVSDDAFHTARLGINYWVNPGYAPLK